MSRVSIALNTVAAGLAEASSSSLERQRMAMIEAADVLWSFGERAGAIDPAFCGTDDARPRGERRRCLREPIPAIFEAAERLSEAVDAHLRGEHAAATALIREADDPAVYEWTDSVWGKYRPDVHAFRAVPGAPPRLAKEDRPQPRMPTRATRAEVLARDGHRCRFCGIPVVSPEVRATLHAAYPEAARWGRRNVDQHAGLQCMWLQFDHVLPNQRGGDSTAANVVVTCAPCNFGRMQFTVEEARLLDPRQVGVLAPHPVFDAWDGLERILRKPS